VRARPGWHARPERPERPERPSVAPDGVEPAERLSGAEELLVAGPLAVVRAHARHVLLAGLVAGLVLGPLAPLAAPAAAVAAAAVLRRAVLGLALLAAVLAGMTVADLRLVALDRTSLGPALGRDVHARVLLLEPPRTRRFGVQVVPARILGLRAAPAASAGGASESAAGSHRAGASRPAAGPPLAGTGERLIPTGQGEPARGAGERLLLRVPSGQGVEAAWPEDPTGAVVAVHGELRPLGRFEAHERRRGAHGELRVRRLEATGERRGGLLGALDGVRRRAEGALTRGLGDEPAGLARGMVLGQDDALDPELRDAFRASGLAHLVAASGTNVALLAALVVALGVVLGIPLAPRLLLAVVAVAAYVPLAGAGPSIQRAGVMGVAVLVAALAGRPASRAYALLLAAAVTLALNPRASADVGWQLSFAAVGALLAFGPALTRGLARVLPGPVAAALALTLAATVGTAPLVALHFERLSVVSLGANLLATPAVAPVMWLGTVAAAVGQVAPGLAELPAAVSAVPLAYLAWLGRTAAGLPGAEAAVDAPPAGLVGALYAALALAAAAGWELRRRRTVAALLGGEERAPRRHDRPSPGRGGSAGDRRRQLGDEDSAAMDRAHRPRLLADLLRGVRALAGPALPRRLLAVAAVAALLLGGAVALRPTPAAPPAGLRVSFLDVGQGDATLVQHGPHAILVDAGPPDGPVLKRLRAAGVRRLDALVLTHASADHDGGAAAVLRDLEVGLVLDGGEANARTPGLRAALAVARARRVPLAPSDAGQVLRAGPIVARVLSPDRERPAPPGADPNPRATVLHVSDGGFDLLLSADAESESLRRLRLPRVEAMKVPHHGSADPGLPDVLARLRPQVAVIPVGPNAYGHPAPSTLRALRAVPTVRRTDRDGTVRLHVEGGRLRLEQTR
jgi:competence protein ComEC